MQQSRTPLTYLRSRSPNTKHAIALIGALLPALLVGYGQYYMKNKTAQSVAIEQKIKPDAKKDEVSAFAALGKILSEGKAAVGDAAVAVKKFNQAYLNEKTSTEQNAVNSNGSKSGASAGVLTNEEAAMVKENK